MPAQHLEPNAWMMLPFGLLLLAIALGPLVAPSFWTRNYPALTLFLAAITVSYYVFGLRAGERALEAGREYVSFILLIGSLFVVSGGIHIFIRGEATPRVNVLFLLLGALLANVLGTTGASMLLIRPWIRTNKYRVTSHHIVFFIFIVSNVGGCLTPIGDPPLFLGYLKGVPFWWVIRHCWASWAVAMGLLLAAFYFVDLANYRRAPAAVREELAEGQERWGVEGLINLVFLAVILLAVFLQQPPFLREALMLCAAAGSYFITSRRIHEANHFNFHPIREVAILFIGIFATMMPVLDWLQMNAGRMKPPGAGVVYWASGGLSSVLDNAPTYLAFFSGVVGMFAGGLSGPAHVAEALAAAGQGPMPLLLQDPNFNRYLLALSVGSVFFGANTYIGNGPNFMVKSIADHQKVRTPHFLEFILKYTLPFMLPVLFIVWLLFLRK